MLSAVEMPPPAEVLIPLLQHIGAPAEAIVKNGDYVKVGQKIAEASGYVSSPIYASVSGTVGKPEEYLRADGRKVPAIRIVSDGEMALFEEIAPPTVSDLDSLILAARESGVVGLGGAGFPLSVKLDALKKGNIDTVVFNGAECEPYITSDTRTMIDQADRIKYGLELIEKYAPTVKKFIFGIEKNKPEAIAKMRQIFSGSDKVTVKPLHPRYPQGAEKVLIFNTTGRTVPEGKLPADVGVLVMNVSTLAAFAEYCESGMPLVSRNITLDGGAVAKPMNIKAPIGTAIHDIIEFGGGTKENVGKILLGGPMMGSAVYSSDEPVTKTTGAITVLGIKESLQPTESPCIRCGRCAESCPHNLIPDSFSKALELDNKEERINLLEKNKIMLCMECGCCSYVCPAGRPLVQNNKLAKAEYRAHLASLKDK